MKTISHFNLEQAPAWKIVIVATTDPDYEMNRIIVYKDYPHFGNVTIVEGGHCSCFGFDEATWDAAIYDDKKEMLQVVNNWSKTGYGAEALAAAPILRYFKAQ